jgi:iron complex outermembrane receptor protein/vitamin B12 transporter
MSFSAFLRAQLSRALSSHVQSSLFLLILVLSGALLCPAAAIHGVVTDPSGARIPGATVSLVSGGKIVNSAVTSADGSFQIMTGTDGRFFLVLSAKSFRQLETPSFYAGRLDSVERNLVLEPQWVRESIVVTATGTPTPQAQVAEATSVLDSSDLAPLEDLVRGLRTIPGVFAVQDGQLGAQTSLFVRGGNSDASKILLDGVSIEDMGGNFDFGTLSTTAIERAEIFRGPNSSLYGADASSGVVSLTTAHGTTSFPSLLVRADAGNFQSTREEAELAGARNKLDYLGAFSWLQSGNALPMDEYHLATSAANLGWQPSANTQIRGTLHYGVDATGVPNAYGFYGISDDRKEGDQDLFVSGSIDNQTTPAFHNTLRYGLARKREQSQQWYPAGICVGVAGVGCDDAPDTFTGGNYYGLTIKIQGANGYSVMGPALMNYSAANGSVYPNRLDLISNSDQAHYQGDYRLTPHLQLLAGFNYANERASEREPVYLVEDTIQRSNDDFLFGVHGDYKSRFFYTLGGDEQHIQQIGSTFSPHIGSSFYALRPRHGIFSGTRFNFSFSKGIREPKLTDQLGSLYNFLEANGGQSTIQQLHISPIDAPATRAWEGGGEQSFWSERLILRVNYFHNEFGREIESVGAGLVPALLPNLTAQQQAVLQAFLQNNYAYSLDLNSLAFRAQGIETTLESGIGKSIFLRGGYTYLDSVVQRSFSSDNAALLGGYAPTFDGIPVGIYSPLKGARPFRRPPHTGFFTATYARKGFTGVFASAYSSRSDDSDFLGYSDLNQGNSLVLPNRNLDFGYARLDLGASQQLLSWLALYANGQNLLSDRHIAPIGYPSLPFTFRMGVRLALGKAGSH